MNKITKTKAFTLISVGLLVIAASQITSHYLTLPDIAQGAFVGVGLGLLFVINGNLLGKHKESSIATY